MPWTEVILTVPDDLKDAMIGELSALGASGTWERGEPSPGHTQLVAYFESSASLDVIRESLHTLFHREDLQPPVLEFRSVKDQDWGEQWKKHWAPFPIGRRFFIIPSWSETECPEDRFPIYIDPGQAFGTG